MKNKQKFSLGRLLQGNIVPIMFIVICIICFPMSGYSPAYLLNELVTRMGRNTFLVLSLLIPVMAGLGMNFAMTLGAMAGEIGLILVSDWQIWGIPGIILAMILSIPISILFGIFCGNLLNKAKGREMITSYIIAFFMTGVYQLIVLFMMGPIIPILHDTLKLPRGYGIRNTVSLLNMRQHLDNLLAINVAGIKIVDDTDDLILISQNGILIRIHAADINVQSRYGSGVRVMRLAEGDKVAVVARVDRDNEAETAQIDNEGETDPTPEELAAIEAEELAQEAAEESAPSDEE